MRGRETYAYQDRSGAKAGTAGSILLIPPENKWQRGTWNLVCGVPGPCLHLCAWGLTSAFHQSGKSEDKGVLPALFPPWNRQPLNRNCLFPWCLPPLAERGDLRSTHSSSRKPLIPGQWSGCSHRLCRPQATISQGSSSSQEEFSGQAPVGTCPDFWCWKCYPRE